MDAMLSEMTPAQFAEWQEFCREEPFGFAPLADLFAILTATVANAAPFRRGQPVTFEKVRYRPGRETTVTTDTLFADAEPTGPDLSRPLPDED